jgi:hypothetical protein
MWEPRRLTTLWASTECYRDSYNFLLFFFVFYAVLAISKGSWRLVLPRTSYCIHMFIPYLFVCFIYPFMIKSKVILPMLS